MSFDSACVCVLGNIATGYFVVVLELCVLRFGLAQINSQILAYRVYTYFGIFGP